MKIRDDYDLRKMLDIGVFVPNWYEKEHIEEMINCQLTDEQFKDICNELRNSDIADDISELIRERLNVQC